MQTSLLSVDQVLDIAFEIFDEMVEDNLEHIDLENYQQHFDQTGAAITLVPADDWEKELGAPVDKELFMEVQIGFAPEEAMEDVLVRMLINRNPEQKDCHLLWKRN